MSSSSAPPSTADYVFGVPLTPEQEAAFPHDNGASRLLGSIWALSVLATIFLALRVYCRLLKRQSLWWDDGILIASWVCILIESSILSYMTTLGYGKHIWDFPLENFSSIMVPTTVAGTFSATAAVWSKTSFGITLLHITDGWIKKVTWFCIISMNIAFFITAILPWVYCTPVQASWDLTIKGKCIPFKVIVHFDIFSASYSAFMDLIMAVLPWRFLWKLQMHRKEKIGVGLAMSMGVFASATAIVKTTKLPHMLNPDFAESIPLWIWGNAETCSSIIAASIPMLRVLVREAKSSRNYPSDYYAKETGLGNTSRFVTISSRPAPSGSDIELHKLGEDDRSDRSILGNGSPNAATTPGSGTPAPQPKNGIMHTTDIVVKYDDEEHAAGGPHAH
ncbi:hypothetical protein C8A05DRAFT_41503 [Staphylotrichum tortipilum]|uniref:Rhodopsin domain-containing protein n=1 Tax=Staphylotrichum tortipilum TaxID=2831512 RepID=A0AAN6RWP4_9PEZI|nr:hypothetical protein C8A05DRAFT_41503 [Staphylotrichum longicolle]